MAESIFPDRVKQKQADNDIKNMLSALTKRLGSLQRVHNKASTGDSSQSDDDDHGTKIITLASTNVGASMRGVTEEKAGFEGDPSEENEALKTYVNNNFQTLNNSIMLGCSYCTNDPGVHLDITDYMEHDQKPTLLGHEKKKGKNKGREPPNMTTIWCVRSRIIPEADQEFQSL
ncbi:uncharacterized protein LOC107818234 [Nicotiana tabacum]|uniref:Uncharacterized protein LOC107818234 n=2 Tax=Nicotiana TaxID=4085 RepID=A0A1S4CET8_TOBAC|nr:PREDICTED: uncharacterized protein LOC104229642 [Nicotiana sylvestris]XP_016499675.1 PREDICTED: uncharacterized protein LOC107818234 [Nicotiana tabacum]